MRIGIIGPDGPDLFAENIEDSLRRMGHTPFHLGPVRPVYRSTRLTHLSALGRQLIPAADQRLQQSLADRAIRIQCELVISVDANLSPQAVATMRDCGIRTALWFPDCIANIGRQWMFLARYDAVFFKDPYVVGRLRPMLDLPVHYLPEACNPAWHRIPDQSTAEPYLVLAGNMYVTRVRLLERLVAARIPIRLYGPGFPRWLGASPVRQHHTGTYIAREQKAQVFRAAAGVLNTLHPAEIHGLNARLFEAAGCGAAVLTEYRQSLPDLFEIDHEVLAFRSFDELVDQARYLLADPERGKRIGEAASHRAHADHTYEQRLAILIEIAVSAKARSLEHNI